GTGGRSRSARCGGGIGAGRRRCRGAIVGHRRLARRRGGGRGGPWGRGGRGGGGGGGPRGGVRGPAGPCGGMGWGGAGGGVVARGWRLDTTRLPWEGGAGASGGAAGASLAAAAGAAWPSPAAWLSPAGASGSTGRRRPSWSALRRTRSACCSSMLEEWLLTP